MSFLEGWIEYGSFFFFQIARKYFAQFNHERRAQYHPNLNFSIRFYTQHLSCNQGRWKHHRPHLPQIDHMVYYGQILIYTKKMKIINKVYLDLSHKSIIDRARLNPAKYHRQDGSSLILHFHFHLKVSLFTFTGWTRQSITCWRTSLWIFLFLKILNRICWSC